MKLADSINSLIEPTSKRKRRVAEKVDKKVDESTTLVVKPTRPVVEETIKQVPEDMTPLDEAAKKGVTFLIVTDAPDSETAEKMLKYPNANLVAVSGAYIVDDIISREKLTIFNSDGEGKKLTIDPRNSVAIIRGSSNTPHGMAIIGALEQSGMFVVNDRVSNDLARNKFSTNMVLNRRKIAIPSSVFVPDENALDSALERLGGKFPIIIKLLTGAEGIGVVIVDSYPALKSTIQALWKQGGSLFLQKYYPIKHDTRSLVLDGKLIGSMRRFKAKDDFRSNVAQGGKFKAVKISKEEQEIVEKAAKAVGCYYCGVDSIEEDGKIYVLEVNSSPGSGAEYMTPEGKVINGDGLVKLLMDHLSDRENWRAPKTTAGSIEEMGLSGIGVMKAKLDTGNESCNSLHATDIDVKGKTVNFKTVEGKKVSKPLVDTVKIMASHKIVEDRPVVLFDVKFDGRLIKNVEFNLSNRGSNDYSVLVGNKFLTKFGFKVDPSHKFLLDDLSEDKE